MRKTGEISESDDGRPPSIPGGYKWDQSFFKKLLFGVTDLSKATGSPSVDVIEIFVKNLRTTGYSDVSEYNTFNWNGSKVERVSHSLASQAGKLLITKGSRQEVQDMNFQEFLQSVIPSQFFKFVAFYPEWVYVQGDNWKESFNPDVGLRPYIPGLTIKVEEHAGKVTYKAAGQSPAKVSSPIANVIAMLNAPETVLPPSKVIPRDVPPGLNTLPKKEAPAPAAVSSGSATASLKAEAEKSLPVASSESEEEVVVSKGDSMILYTPQERVIVSERRTLGFLIMPTF
jgi:hypothetical protein